MSFLYPLGLLGLIGIPILIIIYIIKSKYTEQTVSSTYLWTLSQKFLKRKNPISRLTGIISLILQLLSILLVSLCIARPIIYVPDMAKEYCFILDASGSMNMRDQEATRLDRAKGEIETVIEESMDGSVYSLVYVGDTTKVVYERMTDKKQALSLLSGVETAYGDVDYTDALNVAQGYFDENKAASVYLVTDKDYEKHDNVQIINVANGEQNYAVSEVSYTIMDDELTVNGQLVSYESNATLTVDLYVDDSTMALMSETLDVEKGVKTPFQIKAELDRFSSLRIYVGATDALAMDNEYIIYDMTSENSYNTLLVSDTPFFVQSLMEALVNAELDVVSTEDYTPSSGYGLYIFDSYTPETLPRDGAVWLINPTGNVEGSGFVVREQVELEKADTLDVSQSSSSTVKKLKADMVGDAIYVSQYAKCGMYRNFTSLYTHKGNPIVFAGTNEYGNREVVFAFDLHKSNLPLLYDYIVMMRNFIEYSFPKMVDKTDYYCGDIVDINVLANCKSIRIDSPLGNVAYLDTSSAVSTLDLTEVGVYTVTMNVADTKRVFYLYSAMAESERIPTVEEAEFSLAGIATEGGFDGIYDPILWLFIALALVFLADWGVYCYEKHQLR